MRTLLLPAAAALALGAGFAAPAHALPAATGLTRAQDSAVLQVANRRAPYHHVNRRNDAGNPTGDQEVDRLNEMSLQRARQGEGAMTGTGMGAGGGMGSMGAGGTGAMGAGGSMMNRPTTPGGPGPTPGTVGSP